MICENLSVNEKNHLCFAGLDTVELAKQYKTPMYLLDEDRIRRNCRVYKEAFKKHFPEGSEPYYAGKANAFKGIFRIMKEEGMGLDLVSCGEIYTALQAGFPMEKACFHGNNKTDEDISFAMDKGVGCFAVDNYEELLALDAEAKRRGIKQKIMLRITPGIDPHTYEAVSTGKVDSKFGVPIKTGQAEPFVLAALGMENIDLAGLHCHVGSEVFAEDVFERSAEIMLEFIAFLREKYGFVCRELDLGGGYGVRYVPTDPYIDVEKKIADVSERVKLVCKKHGIEVPIIHMEPGRSIVADAGLTLYSVGSVKDIWGYKSYVAVDGGMTDNPRYALYKAKHMCLAAGKMDESCDLLCDLVGRNCESDDVIREAIELPASTRRGDIIAVCTTGAYCYSMASNYNRVPRAPIVMLKDGESRLVVKRETLDQLCRNDI